MNQTLLDLPDRRAFLQHLERAIDDSAQHDCLLALILVSVRGMRAINRELSYPVGDKLLNYLAVELKTFLREADCLARTGGSEFALLLPSLLSTAQGMMAAQRALGLTREPVEVLGTPVNMHMSVGVAFHPEHAMTAEKLLRCADVALAEARSSGTEMAVYAGRHVAEDSASIALEGELARALEENALTLNYQPIVDLKTRQLSAVEALARWTTPTRGPVPPDVFIAVAEQSGLIGALTEWSLHAALRECGELGSRFGDFAIAVNLSASVLHDPDTVHVVERAMKIWDARPGRLTLEVTESAMMSDPTASLRTLNALSDIGVGIAIDDFGTGYSSLAYLRELPSGELKIDKSFVMRMVEDEGSARIVRAVTGLAHAFELAVVAEGVENQQALEGLERLDCDQAQGSFIGRPMAVEALAQWLEHSAWAGPRR